jgi:hypothetical protein
MEEGSRIAFGCYAHWCVLEYRDVGSEIADKLRGQLPFTSDASC